MEARKSYDVQCLSVPETHALATNGSKSANENISRENVSGQVADFDSFVKSPTCFSVINIFFYIFLCPVNPIIFCQTYSNVSIAIPNKHVGFAQAELKVKLKTLS